MDKENIEIKWEYIKITGVLFLDYFMERLNQLGAEGWELVSTFGPVEGSGIEKGYGMCILKRQKKN